MKKNLKNLLLVTIMFCALFFIVPQSKVYANELTTQTEMQEKNDKLTEYLTQFVTKKDIKLSTQTEETGDKQAYYIITYDFNKLHTVLHLDNLTISITHTRINDSLVNQIVKVFEQALRYYKDNDEFVANIMQECKINRDQFQSDYFDLLTSDTIEEK